MEPQLFSHGYFRQRVVDPVGQFLPSMEPRPFSHGYVSGAMIAQAVPASFNGAMAS